MGGLFVARVGSERGLSVFEKQHAPGLVRLVAGTHRVWAAGMWSGAKPCVATCDDSSFLAVAGTLFYKRAWHQAAAECLLGDIRADTVDDAALFGAFAVTYWDGHRLQLFTDWIGHLCVYRSTSSEVWSTSFLATIEACQQRSLNVQGAFEYLFQESTFGTDTVCAEVERMESDRTHNLTDASWQQRVDPIGPVQILNCSLDDHVDRALAALNPVFDSIVDCTGGRIDAALSGGYDSRLILALLRSRGVQPRLHVYGSDEDHDVRIAKLIAAGEGLSLEHVDKSKIAIGVELPSADIIERNFLYFDGYPIDGIFDSGVDLLTRSARMSDQHLLLNGGGGEIFRNFYYLSDRSYRTRELLYSFYSRFDPADWLHGFNEEEYYCNLERKVGQQLGCEGNLLTRLEIERTYPLVRCRFWMARNTSINCRLGFAMTPLVEPRIVQAALATPLRLKNLGVFEAALIRRVDSRLASYPSAYGHAFDQQPSLRARVSFALTLLRPPQLRRYTFRLKARLKRRSLERRDQTRLPVFSVGLQPRSALSYKGFEASVRVRLATLEFLMETLSIE